MTAGPLKRYANAVHERLMRGASAQNWAKAREAIADHLEQYVEGQTQQVDKEVAVALITALRQATHKEVPALFAPVPKVRGESPDTYSIVSVKRTAAEYCAFCAAHAAEAWCDPRPKESIADWFNVSGRTVDRWIENNPTAMPPSDPSLSASQQFEHLKVRAKGDADRYVHWGGAAKTASDERAARK